MKSLLVPALLCLAASCASTATSDAPRSRIQGPMHYDGTVMVVLPVNDVNAAKDWYSKVLGCTVVYELPEHHWVEVTTPTENAVIGLGQFDAPQGNGGSSMSFGVRDMEKAKAALAANGVAVGEVMEIPSVVKLLEFQDPWGNNLMLYQPLMQEAQRPR